MSLGRRTGPFLFALEIFPSGFRRFATAAPPASDAAARLLRRARAFSAIDAAAADALRDALRVNGIAYRRTAPRDTPARPISAIHRPHTRPPPHPTPSPGKSHTPSRSKPTTTAAASRNRAQTRVEDGQGRRRVPVEGRLSLPVRFCAHFAFDL